MCTESAEGNRIGRVSIGGLAGLGFASTTRGFGVAFSINAERVPRTLIPAPVATIPKPKTAVPVSPILLHASARPTLDASIPIDEPFLVARITIDA